MDKRVLIGIAIIAILGLGFIGYRALTPQPNVPDNGGDNGGGETPDSGGETPDSGGETPDSGTVQGTISGTVLDASGNPVEGVLIQVGSISTTTGANGVYTICR